MLPEAWKQETAELLKKAIDRVASPFIRLVSEFEAAEQRKGWFDKWALRLLVINALLVFGTAYIFYRQLRASEQTDRTLYQTMVATTRAWVTPFRAQVDSDLIPNGTFKFSIKYGNVGKEPALSFVAQQEIGSAPSTNQQSLYEVFPSETITDICAKTHASEGAGVIYPSGLQDYTYTVSETSDKTRQIAPGVANGTKAPFIHGCFAYTTFGVERKSEYCFLGLPRSDPLPRKLAYDFVRCPFGNSIIEPKLESTSTGGKFPMLQWLLKDHTLLVASATFILLTLVAYVIREFIEPKYRDYVLQHPVKPQFVITSSDRYDVGYAPQDYREHFVDELTLPSHTENVFLHFILKAKVAFEQMHLELSFEGDRASRPLFDYYFLPFIKIGTREKRPGEAQGHYIDYHDNYHIDETRDRAKNQTIVYGFMITTRAAGIYPLKIGIAASGIDGTAWLTVRVEDHPSTRMRCAEHARCFITPTPKA